MDGNPTQIAIPNELAHPPGNLAELRVMADRQFEAFLLSQSDQFLRLACIQGKGLFDVDMTPFFQAPPADFVMGLRGGSNMNDIRACLVQEFAEVFEIFLDPEPVVKLLGHELFLVTDPDKFTSGNSPDLHRMRIGDLPASNDADLKHARPFHGNSRNIFSVPPASEPSASNPIGF